MGISEHVSAELLSNYLRGATAPGVALAVEAHLELCEECLRDSEWNEDPGRNLEPGTPPGEAQLVGAPDAAVAVAGELPSALARVAKGPWRRIARGVRRSQLEHVSGLGESVHLLEAEPGAPLKLPAAAHILMVLRGAVRDGSRVHSPGDFIEAVGSLLKDAFADGASGCLCLIVGDDDLYHRPFLPLLRPANRQP